MSPRALRVFHNYIDQNIYCRISMLLDLQRSFLLRCACWKSKLVVMCEVGTKSGVLPWKMTCSLLFRQKSLFEMIRSIPTCPMQEEKTAIHQQWAFEHCHHCGVSSTFNSFPLSIWSFNGRTMIQVGKHFAIRFHHGSGKDQKTQCDFRVLGVCTFSSICSQCELWRLAETRVSCPSTESTKAREKHVWLQLQ